MSAKDNLTAEELLVQADRIIEQYKLDLNDQPKPLLDKIVSLIIDKENKLATEVKTITNFF